MHNHFAGRAVGVLLVDDDEDDYLITCDLLRDIPDIDFTVEWVQEADVALERLTGNTCDICLLDYRLGCENGLELLRRAVAGGATVPVLLMTGQGDSGIDRAAVAAGASDYLVKGQITPVDLDRAIRYAWQQRQTLRELQKQTDFMTAILETAGALIMVLDGAGRILHWNRQCEETTGYRIAEIVGKPFAETFLPPGVKASEGVGGTGQNEADWLTRDGRIRRIAWSSTPLADPDGHHHVIGIGVDVTEQRQAEAALARAHAREVEVGGSIQKTLLVRQPVLAVPGLRVAATSLSSEKVGGDYFDFFVYSDTCVDMLVGDVMGKGVPAALLAAATKSHFQRIVRHLCLRLVPFGRLPQPDEIVAAVHAALTPDLAALHSFVTLTYARFDLASRVVTFVDCGHPRPLHISAADNGLSLLDGENVPLGLKETERYKQKTVPFASGDTFFFYSDGLSEAARADDELFGAQRVGEAVSVAAGQGQSPAEVITHTLEAVQTFIGNGDNSRQNVAQQIQDDLTCIAVQIAPWQVPQQIAAQYLEIPAHPAHLEAARRFVEDFCAGLLPVETIDHLALAINEALTNIMRHAYCGDVAGRIQIEAGATGQTAGVADTVRFSIYDNGAGFPAWDAIAPPRFDGDALGGFGVFIIRECFDDVTQARDEMGRNCLRLVKYIEQEQNDDNRRN